MATATGRAKSAWGMSQSTVFDPNQVHRRASDQNGHSKYVSAPVMPDVKAMAMRLVGDPAWPEYESVQDVVRDGLAHIVHFRKDQLTRPEDRETAVDLLKLVAREERIRHIHALVTRYRHVQDRLETTLVDLMRSEAWGLMRSTLAEEEDEVLSLPEPFRAQAISQIRAWRAKLPRE